jgi:hypothetical protein
VQLRTDKENLSVEYNYSTVVPNITVYYWHADVEKDLVEGLIGEDLEHHFPAAKMEVRNQLGL